MTRNRDVVVQRQTKEIEEQMKSNDRPRRLKNRIDLPAKWKNLNIAGEKKNARIASKSARSFYLTSRSIKQQRKRSNTIRAVLGLLLPAALAPENHPLLTSSLTSLRTTVMVREPVPMRQPVKLLGIVTLVISHPVNGLSGMTCPGLRLRKSPHHSTSKIRVYF